MKTQIMGTPSFESPLGGMHELAESQPSQEIQKATQNFNYLKNFSTEHSEDLFNAKVEAATKLGRLHELTPQEQLFYKARQQRFQQERQAKASHAQQESVQAQQTLHGQIEQFSFGNKSNNPMEQTMYGQQNTEMEKAFAKVRRYKDLTEKMKEGKTVIMNAEDYALMDELNRKKQAIRQEELSRPVDAKEKTAILSAADLETANQRAKQKSSTPITPPSAWSRFKSLFSGK